MISRDLGNRVQERRAQNCKKYRNPKHTQLLSGLVRCGAYGHGSLAYRRCTRGKRKGPVCEIHAVAYKWSWTTWRDCTLRTPTSSAIITRRSDVTDFRGAAVRRVSG